MLRDLIVGPRGAKFTRNEGSSQIHSDKVNFDNTNNEEKIPAPPPALPTNQIGESRRCDV